MARVVEAIPAPINRSPDPWKESTSYVERQNLTMRMCMARLTRLSLAFSKKLDNLKAALALHFVWYNFWAGSRQLKGDACDGGWHYRPYLVYGGDI